MRYRDAMAWQRKVNEALSPLGMTLTEWLVLDATRELIRTTHDAVSQNDVAAALGMDRSTVSKVMKVLEKMGLVDRGPDLSARGYRIWVHSRAQRCAEHGRAVVEAVSVEWLTQRRNSTRKYALLSSSLDDQRAQ
jgi:DNA-binding MarR family transcriptional regulator